MNLGVKAAIEICGSQAVVAKACGISQPTVFKWLGGAKMDVAHVSSIVKATNGEVKPQELRPDVDWETIKQSL